MYPNLPSQKPNFMLRKLQGKEKQRFDSADFEMKKQQQQKPSRGPGGISGNKQEIPPEVRSGNSFTLLFFTKVNN